MQAQSKNLKNSLKIGPNLKNVFSKRRKSVFFKTIHMSWYEKMYFFIFHLHKKIFPKMGDSAAPAMFCARALDTLKMCKNLHVNDK